VLFSVIVDVLRTHRPRYFILENVKRLLLMEKGVHFATVLSALTELGYQIEWRLVNTRHFGLAQNRERVLILGSLDVKDNYPTIRLAESADLYEGLESNFRWVTDVSSWLEIERHHRKFANWGLAFRQRFFSCSLEHFSEVKPIVTLRSVLQSTVDPIFDFTESTLQRLEESTRINKFLDGVQLLYNQNRGARMGYTVFGIDGIAPTLTAATSRHYERYKVGDRYRRLTNVEYARLQGFPDDHCSAVSVYNQYALYGNAIPPVFVSWVLEKILQNRVTSLENAKEQQLHLFQEPMTYADKSGIA
jgi:DNA (cytosine-5)-methyltransferase 1